MLDWKNTFHEMYNEIYEHFLPRRTNHILHHSTLYSDVGMGGFFYWVCGHAFAYGNNPTYATPFNGFGGFFFDADEREHFAGIAYLHFFYQMGN